MPELTPEVLKAVSDALAQYGIKAELSIEQGERIYKAWEPHYKEEFFIEYDGEIEKDHSICDKKQSHFFNAFRTEETAKRSAATDKINHCVWQWKEQNDPDASHTSPNRRGIDFDYDNKKFQTSNCGVTSLFSDFSTEKKASQFLKECSPYLDEYVRAMGWMN